MKNIPAKLPFRRHNPLLDTWMLTSPQRFNRPWQGQIEKNLEQPMPEYDPSCYLCPGNKRTNGETNPKYTASFTFVNDFSALIPGAKNKNKSKGLKLLKQIPETGVCEVLCYSPKHNKTMATMDVTEITDVISMWKQRYVKIGQLPHINHIQIFENRGSEVGNSNPHPHGQLWAQQQSPAISATEQKNQRAYFKKYSRLLLLDYVRQEIKSDQRIIYKNKDFTLLVPFWAEWPYETLLLPNFPLPSLNTLTEDKFANLALSMQKITQAYAKLFNRPLYGAPYTMGIHQKPTHGSHKDLQLHIHFQPPLLTPTRQKFMVGYERFAEAQRDITAEQAAEQLKNIINKL